MRSKHKFYTCGHCCLALCLSIALCLRVALYCILSVLFSVMLFLHTSSALLHPCLQCVHSVAPVAKVSPLAMVSSLVITCAAQRYFTVWLVERLVAGLFGIVFPLQLYILVVGGCYCLACLQSSQLISFASCFFILLFQWFSLLLLLFLLLFTFVYFDWLPLNVFQCDCCPCWCCLILFCLSLPWGGGSWLGCGYSWPRGWFHPAGVGQLYSCFRNLISTCDECC